MSLGEVAGRLGAEWTSILALCWGSVPSGEGGDSLFVQAVWPAEGGVGVGGGG